MNTKKQKRRIEKTRKALCEWWNPRESIRYYEVMESNEHDLRESAQGACLRGPRSHTCRPAGALNYQEARPWEFSLLSAGPDH